MLPAFFIAVPPSYNGQHRLDHNIQFWKGITNFSFLKDAIIPLQPLFGACVQQNHLYTATKPLPVYSNKTTSWEVTTLGNVWPHAFAIIFVTQHVI